MHRWESTISHGSRRPQIKTVVFIRRKARHEFEAERHVATKERPRRQKE